MKKHWILRDVKPFFLLILVIGGFACADKSTPNNTSSKLIKEQPNAKAIAVETKPAIPKKPVTKNTKTSNNYPWKSDYSIEAALVNQVACPNGFTRTKIAKGSFGDWLRHLPLKAVGTSVHLYNGQLKSRQDVHQRVLDIDTGKKDLQQCADAVMRLKAEYHYSQAAFEKIHFNFTSGDRVAFDDWSSGKKPIVIGNQVNFSAANGTQNISYPNFKKYLVQIFNYAGTASLSKELKKVSVNDLQIGDVFIQGGFPGHAVLVVDMAANDQGEKIFLLSQSYMPAQDIHLLKNFNDSAKSPWYNLSFGDELNTPEWSFTASDLMRFSE